MNSATLPRTAHECAKLSCASQGASAPLFSAAAATLRKDSMPTLLMSSQGILSDEQADSLSNTVAAADSTAPTGTACVVRTVQPPQTP